MKARGFSAAVTALGLVAGMAATPAVAETAAQGAAGAEVIRPGTGPGAGPGEGRTQAGFTFHMVKPPAPGTTRFIKVQIDPEVQKRWIEDAPAVTEHRSDDPAARPVTSPVTSPDQPSAARTAQAGSAGGGPRKAAYGWYWQAISPALADRAGRFQAALAELSMGPGGSSVRAPSLPQMRALSRTWGRDILKATVGTRISPALVLAVMSAESAGRPDAVSPKGAQGLMQLIPATAGRFGVDASDPAQNIQGAVAYLDWLMKTFKGDPLMVLAAYNAGENAVKSAGGVPDYPETRDYVPKVLAAWKVAQNLCVTPPATMRDGCVFKQPATASAATAATASDG